MGAVNDPGVREKDRGFVVQMSRRSEQLENIAARLKAHFTRQAEAARLLGEEAVSREYHGYTGYCEQLLIIADELKSIGK